MTGTGADLSPEMFERGAVVKLIEDVGEVPAGAIGIVVGRYTDDDSVLIEAFLDTRVRAPASAVAPIEVDPTAATT